MTVKRDEYNCAYTPSAKPSFDYSMQSSGGSALGHQTLADRWGRNLFMCLVRTNLMHGGVALGLSVTCCQHRTCSQCKSGQDQRHSGSQANKRSLHGRKLRRNKRALRADSRGEKATQFDCLYSTVMVTRKARKLLLENVMLR
jgi:hypothetical protein